MIRRGRNGQATMEYVVVIIAVIMAISWAAAPARNMFSNYAKAVEKAMRDLF